MLSGDFGFPEPTVIWLHPGEAVHCSICDIPERISRVSIALQMLSVEVSLQHDPFGT